MLSYALDQLDEEKMQKICEELTSESLTLEFKRDPPGKEKDDKAEFLKDVVALANASGGDLIYGIEEKSGSATRINPITGSTHDAEKRRLGQILDGGVEPRVTGIRFRSVDVFGGFLLILRIPQSYDGPHRVSSNGSFYLRSGTHTTNMSYEQLRTAFDRTATLTDRANAFRRERLEAIRLGQLPKPIKEGPCCVAHVIPLVSLAGRQSIDVVELSTASAKIMSHHLGENTWTLNLDGIMTHRHISSTDPYTYSYNQIYRTGCTESVFDATAQWDSSKPIPSSVITENLRISIGRNVELLKKSGISGPTLISAAMLNVQGVKFGVGGISHPFRTAVADRDSLVIPPIWVESLDALSEIDDVVRPIMDILWQAFGIERCLEYSADGKWAPRK